MGTPNLVQVVREFMSGITGPGIVAVSGGADSVALLHALTTCGFACTVAHVNHQLRGAESDADELFVKELAAKLGVGFRSTRIDLLKHGGNLEAAARRVRYEWLNQVAVDVGASWIATGHTANDQAETVLHRLIRGTGLQGLRGIGRAGGVSPLILRPLLTVTRREVQEFLHSLNQPYRTDSSNADPRFTRNRIRAELVPLMESFNPEVVAVLSQLAEQAHEAFSYLELHAREMLILLEKPRAGDTIILNREYATMPKILLRQMLRLIWEREGWPMGEMDYDHWTRAAELHDRDFPGGVTMRSVGRVVQLKRQS